MGNSSRHLNPRNKVPKAHILAVHSVHHDSVENEAIRAAFRNCGMDKYLTPKFSALVSALRLVDTQSSSIRCQGQCKNGGRCSQIISKIMVIRQVLELQAIALDEKTAGEDLLMIDRCAERAKKAVQAWREDWLEDMVVREKDDTNEEDGDCKNCVQLKERLKEVVAERDIMSGEVNNTTIELDEQYEIATALTDESDVALCKVHKLEEKVHRLKVRCEHAEDRGARLAEELQSLQIRHDGLLGRMASEVEQGQRSSRQSTLAGSSRTPTSATFEFKGIGAGPNRVGELSGQATPPTTPLSKFVSRLTSQEQNQIPSLFDPPASLRSLLRGATKLLETAQLGAPPTLEATPAPTAKGDGNVLFKSGGLQSTTPRQKNEKPAQQLSPKGGFIARPWAAAGEGEPQSEKESKSKSKPPPGFRMRPKREQ